MALFLGLLVTYLIWMLGTGSFFRGFSMMFGRYYLPLMISDILHAAFYMAGVVYSIQYFGLKWWSIMLGLIGAYLAAYLLSELIGLTIGSGFFFRFRILMLSILGNAVQGLAIWLGIRYFMLKKRVVAG